MLSMCVICVIHIKTNTYECVTHECTRSDLPSRNRAVKTKIHSTHASDVHEAGNVKSEIERGVPWNACQDDSRTRRAGTVTNGGIIGFVNAERNAVVWCHPAAHRWQ